MTPIIVAILVASLLGSTHCAGMCGAFVMMATAATPPGHPAPPFARRLHVATQAAYHLGRLGTYLALGTAAGGLGAAFDMGGTYAIGVQRSILLLTAVLMVMIGGAALARARGVRLPTLPVPPGWVRIVRAVTGPAMRLSPVPRSAALGVCTTLLPCGWLYTFVLGAAGTGSPITGAIVMAAFWLGTVPMLAAVGAGARALTGPFAAHLPTLTALALMGSGLATLAQRTAHVGRDFTHSTPAIARASDGTLVVSRREGSDPPPCCREGDHAP